MDAKPTIVLTKLQQHRISMLGARHAASYQSWACLKQRAASWFMSNKCCNKLRHAENGNTTEQILKDILLQHGVPPDSVQHRVQHAIMIMGLSALQSDIESTPEPRDLWNRLKAHADRYNFRWVTRDELQHSSNKKKELSKAKTPLPRRRQELDPWTQNSDPWATARAHAPAHDAGSAAPESYDVEESFEDTDGNAVCRIPTTDLKPGASGFALVAPEEVSSIVTIFKAANQLEPCLALCPTPVPGVPAQCENLLVRNTSTQRLKQVPVYMHQLGAEPVSLKRQGVIEVSKTDTIALVLYAHKSRMQTEDWKDLLKSPRSFLTRLLSRSSVVDSWHKNMKPDCSKVEICFRVPLDQLSSVLSNSGKLGVSFGFYRSETDELTKQTAAKYDLIPLDPSKSFDQVKALAARLPGEPVMSFTDSKLSLMVRKTQYAACLQSIEKSFLVAGVRPFPVACTKILKGFDPVADNSTVHQLAASAGWHVHIESTWTYREGKDARRRAFRVAFREDPKETQVWTSQGYVILEDPLTKKQRLVNSAGGSSGDRPFPNWRWSSESSAQPLLQATLQSAVEDQIAKLQARTEEQLQHALVKVDEAAVACRQVAEQQKEITRDLESFRADQSTVNSQVLAQFNQTFAHITELQTRQDQSEASVKERLQVMEQAQREGLASLQRLVDEKRPRIA